MILVPSLSVLCSLSYFQLGFLVFVRRVVEILLLFSGIHVRVSTDDKCGTHGFAVMINQCDTDWRLFYVDCPARFWISNNREDNETIEQCEHPAETTTRMTETSCPTFWNRLDCVQESSYTKPGTKYRDLDIRILTLPLSASQRVVLELLDMLQIDDIRSRTDLGAGLGQYKCPNYDRNNNNNNRNRTGFVYRAHNGAGNVESYTLGFIRFVDLSVPLALPRSDWVLSLEVGTHSVALRNLLVSQQSPLPQVLLS